MLLLLDVILWTVVGTFLFWWFYKVIIRSFDRRAQRRIDAASNMLEASKIRKRILVKRKWTLGVYFAFAMLVCILICIFASMYVYERDIFRYLITYAVIAIVLLIQLLYERSRQDLYGNISFETAEDYLTENPEFYLYLRGFENDVPFNCKVVSKEQRFSEAGFAEAVEYGKGLPLGALGMTKEIDSPIGAVRVYVDDTDWQQKVRLLMDRAKRIFILINSRQSCLWEIGQAKEMKEKIVFIVDDRDKYAEVRNRFGDEFDMPDPPAGDELYFFEPGGPAKAFPDTLDGYLSILNLSMDIIEPQKVQERKDNMLKKKEKDAKKSVMVIAGIVITSVVLLNVIAFVLSLCGRL